MRTFLGSLCLLLIASGVASLSADEFPALKNSEKSTTSPLPPQEVVKTCKLPAGFQMQVFAAEPDVQNPIAITTDERGRLWVAENFSWSGGGAGGFDGQQRDRIVILEDTDHDGKHDKRTVFHDDLRKLTSLEVGFGGVWAIALPKLLFIPDRNRDDLPDSEPQVVLDGFNEGIVGHTPANGLKWGPDGWLYARHGIQATSSIGQPGASQSQRLKINTGVWRYHPQRGTVEAVMHGMTNSWGFDYNAHNEMFVINTVIGHLWHTVPGAHVKRMYGVDLNPHTYQLIEQTADHVHWDTGESWGDVKKGMTDKTSAAGGGHAHIGLMIYQGDNWPEEYRHHVYTLNLHGLRINSDQLVRQGAGYTAKHGPDLCHVADPWFRGMDLITGPDGGVFIADWSDTGECHDHDGVHRTSGRIYKLTYGTPKKIAPFDLAKLPSADLIDLLLHENVWWARQAQRVLTERAVAKTNENEHRDACQTLRRKLEEQISPARRIRLLSALYSLGDLNEAWLLARLSAAEEHERVVALRFLVDADLSTQADISTELRKTLLQVARNDASGLVQLYLASALQRLPLAVRGELAQQLVRHQTWALDRMYPHMLWYGIEPLVPRDSAAALEIVRYSQVPLVTQNIARRLTLELETAPEPVEKLVAAALATEDPNHATAIFVGMAEALRGWRQAMPPQNWKSVASSFPQTSQSDALKNALRDLNVVFGDGRALDELRKVVTNGQADAEERRQALRALITSQSTDLVPVLLNLLGDRAVNAEALRGLARFESPQAPQQILGKLDGFPPSTRAEAINTLASRPLYARTLLKGVQEKKIDKNEISAFHARQMRAFEDSGLTELLEQVWGHVRESASEKQELMAKYRTDLGETTLRKANLGAGRALFEKTCANCHILFGNGKKVGPDLTGSNRKNLEYLLENIVDPSASVAADFRALTLVLANGRILNGVIIEQNERTITLQTAQEAITIDRREIEETKQTSNSLMPDGLLQNLSPEQIRDLIGYLQAVDQVPLAN